MVLRRAAEHWAADLVYSQIKKTVKMVLSILDVTLPVLLSRINFLYFCAIDEADRYAWLAKT